jgi:uncharacterized protein YjbJ (UPF0337 family)
MEQGDDMNKDILEGKWNEVKGKVKSQWSKLTDDDLGYLSGRATELSGVIQKRYGYKKDQAEREVNEFVDSLS